MEIIYENVGFKMKVVDSLPSVRVLNLSDGACLHCPCLQPVIIML